MGVVEVEDEEEITDVRLGIHSNVTSDAGLTDGHAWISVENGTRRTTYGLWPDDHPNIPDNGPASDVRVGIENDFNPVASNYYDLNQSQVDDLREFLNTDAEWGYTHTCADWARDAVAASVGDSIDVDDWLGFETPRELSESLGH